METCLGLDYGDKTIGVAVNSPLDSMAVGVETIFREEAVSLRNSINRLGELIKQYKVTAIVLGFPKNLDNSHNERCDKTIAFKEKLERNFKRIPVILWDERLSTAEAMRAMTSGMGKAEIRKARTRGKLDAHIDEIAAMFILQNYLDHQLSTKRGNQRMNENEAFDELNELDVENDSAITMFDGEGNEVHYNVLSSKEDGGCMYMLVEEVLTADELNNGEADATAEVLHFKCIADEDEEMIFELVDEDHEEFDKVFAMFKEDYDDLGIIY